jgi:hypothetical protein
VHKGTRYVMSLWFTCDPERYFPDFLDGEFLTQRRNVSTSQASQPIRIACLPVVAVGVCSERSRADVLRPPASCCVRSLR